MKKRYLFVLLLMVSCMSPYLRLSDDYFEESEFGDKSVTNGLYRVEERYLNTTSKDNFREMSESRYRFYLFQDNYVVSSVLYSKPNNNELLKQDLENMVSVAGKYHIDGNDIELTFFGAWNFNGWNSYMIGEILSDTLIVFYYDTTDKWKDTTYYKDYVLELVDSTYRVPNIERIDEWKVKKRKK
jgi:hypothetical protein